MAYSKTNPNGQATMSNSGPVVIASDQSSIPVAATLQASTNNIGDVDVLTLPSLPAGTNNIGDVDVLSVPAPLSTTGGGTEATALRVTIATDSTGVLSIDDNGSSITVDGTVAVSGTVAVTQSGTWDEVGINDSGNSITVDDGGTSLTIDGNVGLSPQTSGGLTTFHLVSAASTNATNIKASAGQVFGWYIYNSNASARKVAFHNTAGTPTAGASIFMTLVIPPTSGANVEFTNGIAFSTGIAITTVTGLADSDTAAVAANDLIINIFYK